MTKMMTMPVVASGGSKVDIRLLRKPSGPLGASCTSTGMGAVWAGAAALLLSGLLSSLLRVSSASVARDTAPPFMLAPRTSSIFSRSTDW